MNVSMRKIKKVFFPVVVILGAINLLFFFLYQPDTGFLGTNVPTKKGADHQILLHSSWRRGGSAASKAEVVTNLGRGFSSLLNRGSLEHGFLGTDDQEVHLDVEEDVIPIQQNPWIDRGGEKKTLPGREAEEIGKNNDPMANLGHYSMHVKDKCHIRQFYNHSAYSRPEFVGEYSSFRFCMAKASDHDVEDEKVNSWIAQQIDAKVGEKGQLIIKTRCKFTLRPKLKCGEEPPKVLIFVFSDVENVDRRNAIRQTWGGRKRLLQRNHKLVFVVGDVTDASITGKLSVEAKDFGDILQSEVVMGQRFSEHKQVLSVLAWTYRNCELARFVVKTTDSSFLNSHRLETFAEQEMYAANRVYGHLLKRMQPNRNSDSDHYVAEEDWPWTFFPPFLQGPSYILSGDVVPRILVAARFTPIHELEQVYFTGLLALTNRIMRIGINEFFASTVPSEEDEAPRTEEQDCVFAKHGIIEQVESGSQMEAIFRQVEEVQETRNVTCLVVQSCLAKINGKCIWYSSKANKGKGVKRDKHRRSNDRGQETKLLKRGPSRQEQESFR